VSSASPSDLEPFARFCERVLTTENGDPLGLHEFQRRMLGDFFDGCRETLILISKKNGKSTLLGALALFHLCSTPDAECVIAAASRDQAGIMLRQAQGFIRRSPHLQERLQVKQREIVHKKLGGRIRILASDVDTADGVIPTLALVDELHRHKSAELYGVFGDGLGPRNGQMITISTAGDSEDSPLGHLRAKAHQLPGVKREGVYRHGRHDGFALHEWALEANEDREDLELVAQANPAPWQTVAVLRERRNSPSMTEWRWARFACGIWGLGSEPAFDRDLWDSLAAEQNLPPDGTFITLGFDGARRRDTTVLVGTTIATGHQFVLGVWARPEVADDEWEVPEDEVDQVVEHAFETWDVWRLYGDPPYWESALDRWAAEYGKERVVRWWTNRLKKMAYALRAWVNDWREGVLSHDGDETLSLHIGNAVRRDTKMRDSEDELLWVIGKSSSSSERKIDAAMAACLAWEARGDAIRSGASGSDDYDSAQW